MNSAQQTQIETRLHFLDYWRVIRSRRAIVAVVFLLVLLVAATVTVFQPKIYQSACRIKVEQEHPTVAVFEQQAVPSYDPYFLQTQYEIIQSQKVLHPVIEQAKLQERWAHGGPKLGLDLAFRLLKRRLSVRRFRDTSLIEIIVEDEAPYTAAELANLIAKTFERDRLEVKRAQTMKGLDKLRDELRDQRARVEAAQQKVESVRRELNVPVFGTVKLNDVTIQTLEQQLTQAKVDAVTKESRLKEMQKLTPLQLRNAVATVFSDPAVQTLLQSLSDTEVSLEKLKLEYGPDHPQLRATIVQHDKLKEQVDARLEGIMAGYSVDYKMAQERVNELQKQLDTFKKSSLALDSEAYLPYRNAVRDQEAEERLFEAINTRLRQSSVELEVPRSPVEVLDQAEAGYAPVRPNMTMNITLAAIVGLLLGIGLAFFIEFLDTSVKIMDDVERYLGLPVLGVIPQGTVQLGRNDSSSAHLEAYRMLRTNIDFSQASSDRKSIAVLSAGAGEGKSFTVINLGFVYAQQGARVLIVDSDLRRPTTHKYFAVVREPGLSDYLSGSKSVEEIIHPTQVPNISLIPAGSIQSSKLALPLLTSHRMEQLINDVGQQFDVVLYDTPPVLGISDATVIAREVGRSILIVQHRRFPRAMSQRARKMIETAGGKLLGVVVNNVHVDHEDSYYYYHEHYDRYLQTAAKPAEDKIQLPDKY